MGSPHEQSPGQVCRRAGPWQPGEGSGGRAQLAANKDLASAACGPLPAQSSWQVAGGAGPDDPSLGHPRGSPGLASDCRTWLFGTSLNGATGWESQELGSQTEAMGLWVDGGLPAAGPPHCSRGSWGLRTPAGPAVPELPSLASSRGPADARPHEAEQTPSSLRPVPWGCGWSCPASALQPQPPTWPPSHVPPPLLHPTDL